MHVIKAIILYFKGYLCVMRKIVYLKPFVIKHYFNKKKL